VFMSTRRATGRETLAADLCVIGAGAAGLPIARHFAGTRVQVVLLEAGGLAAGAADRGIYEVVHAPAPGLGRHPSLTGYFGGNTNHWLGNCSPLEAEDFTRRAWIPHSGWPLDRDTLAPFYERAQAACGLGAFHHYAAANGNGGGPPPAAGIATYVIQQASEPSFRARYADTLGAADNVLVGLDTRATCLEPTSRGDAVRAVEAVGPDGRRTRITARAVVLAAGGVENARLLLASRGAAAAGLGNAHDLVGRFFMDHPFVDIPLGDDAAARALAVSHTPRPVGDALVWTQLGLTEECRRRERLPAIRLWVDAGERGRPLAVEAAWRVARLLRRGARPAEVLAEARLALTDPGAVLRAAARRARGGGGAGRPAPSTLRVALEQTPDPENRVVLAAPDGAGEPAAALVYRLRVDEQQRHARALRIAADAVGLPGARLERQLRLLLRAGRVGSFWHHMGATRMHEDPRRGVVGADCRVHGVANLFVAGSSVFPTGGGAAPTLTLVALALRLADHLQAGGA